MEKTLLKLLDRLELSDKQGLISSKNYTSFPFRTINALNKIKPDAIFCYNDQPYILFFDFTKNEFNEIEIFKNIWNFNQTPVIFFIKTNQIEIYNGFIFDRLKSKLDILASEDDIDDFNYWDIQSNKLWIKYQNKFSNKTRVDYYLLDNIKQTRQHLINNGLENDTELVNSLIGRLIFTRYLIDRNVNVDNRFINGTNKSEKNQSLLNMILNKSKLYSFFAYLKENFNGDLFPLIKNEKNIINDIHLDLLYNLFNGDKISEHGIQYSLFNYYDFEIIPIELISNIYERFIGDEKQNTNKAFYTPPFLVDYILSETIDKHLHNSKTSKCIVLDPSCGSGIFLVEALRRIIEKEIIINKKLNKLTLKRLVKDNIFGIDKDENAINLAIFSLYITLLDYQHPKDIEKFKFPELKGINFFKADFFDKSDAFNIIFKKKNVCFDFILGNPPWGNIKEPNHLNYCKNEKNPVPISDNQIAQSFIIRVKDFSSNETKITFIVTSKIFYNILAKDFRAYLLKYFYINKVLELSTVRRYIFEHAIGPATIVFYKYAFGKDTDNNTIEHISLKPNLFLKYFKSIVIEKYDNKLISQQFFKLYDWLWKVMLYGNILDFYLIKRLRTLKNVNDIIKEHNFHIGQGIEIGINGNKETDYLINYPYLDTKKNILSRFFIDNKKLESWKPIKVHRNRKSNKEIFNGPQLLFKFGLTPSFQAVTAYSENNVVFLKSVTAIKGKTENSDILKNLVGVFNSKLFTYYILLIGSSTGIEREQAHNEDEKFTFPVVINHKISELVNLLEKSIRFNKTSLFEKLVGINDDIKSPQVLEEELDNSVFKLYNLSESDIDLIDYAHNFSIKLIQGSHEPLSKVTDMILDKYSNIFINHFNRLLQQNNEFLVAEIYNNHPYLIAINFQIKKTQTKDNIYFNTETNIDKILKFIGNLSFTKISKNISIQKDIKGIEKDSFYIIKTNEIKNWHTAIARLDLNEFMSAMIKSEIKRFRYAK